MYKTVAATLAVALTTSTAMAATDISWWHGMGGRNGEVINEISQQFNDAQSECKLTPISKGTYEEALSSGIAAFRSGEQPNILQVFDAGAATIIAAKGATIPAEDLIKGAGESFNREDFIAGVRNFYADSDGKFIGMPFNSSAPIMYLNTEAFEKAGVEPPKTWEDFEAIAPKLLDAGFLPMTASQLTWMMVENFKSRNNQQFATNNNGYDAIKGTELLVNDDNQVMMFEKLKEWADKGFFGFYGAGWSDNAKPFAEGKSAMWIGSSGSFGGLKKSVEFPFGAVFMPYWDAIEGAGTQSFIGGAALFAMANKPWPSFLDALGNGLGYGAILCLVALFREILGSGALFGIKLVPQAVYDFGYADMGLMVIAPGAFIILGLIIWAQRTWTGYAEA